LTISSTALRLIAIGDGLAAGVGDFSLRHDGQRMSFPAQIARQMGSKFPQALLRSPGIGHAPGFGCLPVVIPAPMQASVLDRMPPAQVCDLCIPGMTLRDAVTMRPEQPVVHRHSAKQTALNLILGLDALAHGEPGRTQLECALSCRPELTLISLGYTEALEATVEADVSLLPDPELFRGHYSQILSSLRQAGSETVVLTVPDPLDTAYASSLQMAERTLKIESALLNELYELEKDDLLTVNGLMEIGCHFFGRAIGPLSGRSVLNRATAEMLRQRVCEINKVISDLAGEFDALLYDVHELFSRLRRCPYQIGSRAISADYLGGVYRLNGYYPGYTGHALIANELIECMNQRFSTNLPSVNLESVLAGDPAASYLPARGRCWSRQDLPAQVPQAIPTCDAASDIASTNHNPGGALRLPKNLEQVLPLSSAASYFGDGIGAMNCMTERDIQWGNAAELTFGGLAIVDSHLSGSIGIKFTPPVGNKTKFEISFRGGFTGTDAILICPQLFRMPFQHNRVDEVPQTVSSGTLDLASGEVSDLHVYAQYRSTALLTLVSVNPNFPKQPLSFPGPYGSAWARFEQRSDGNLDFTFYGSTYVPLGKRTRWPLPFAGPSGEFATVPAEGTVMHPHLHLSTKAPEESPDRCPEIPYNTVQEYTLHTHNSAFGDQFTLTTPELGGPAKGRSHVMGRIQIQFGAKTRSSVPIAITAMNPGGMLTDMSTSPITIVFPGQLSAGPQGFYELLRFPRRTYSLDDLAIIDDPFDISMGLVDLRSGALVNQLLHRGFINQDLIFALLRVEPRTPKDSFYFRGPARLERGPDGRSVFRFNGLVRVPYPEGFLFPQPNLTTGLVVGPESVLDPFLWMQAMEGGDRLASVMRGEETDVVASTGDRFSYRYVVPADVSRAAPLFEYENHSQKGAFFMHTLAWISFHNSLLACDRTQEFDTVTFTGFGIWRKDGFETIEQATVQITNGLGHYVGIQIGSGDVSNVNTKPQDEASALP